MWKEIRQFKIDFWKPLDLSRYSSGTSCVWRNGASTQLHSTFWVSVQSVQSLSHVHLCNPIDCSMPGLPVHHQLLEPTQTRAHCIGEVRLDQKVSKDPLKTLYLRDGTFLILFFSIITYLKYKADCRRNWYLISILSKLLQSFHEASSTHLSHIWKLKILCEGLV